MKKLLSALVLAALVTATPAVAGDRHRDGRNYTQHEHRYEHRRDDRRYRRNSDGVIIGVIAGVVLGAVLSNDRRYDDRDRYYHYTDDVYPERVCYEIRRIDRYGRVISTFDCR